MENSHSNLDAKDEKSIANKLDQASKQEKRQEKAEQQASKPPTRHAEDVSVQHMLPLYDSLCYGTDMQCSLAALILAW